MTEYVCGNLAETRKFFEKRGLYATANGYVINEHWQVLGDWSFDGTTYTIHLEN